MTHSSTGIGAVTRHRSARLAGEARIGPGVYIDPIIQETQGTELIGGEVMRHFVWTFDQKNERLRIVPMTEGSYTMEAQRNHPLAILGRDSGWEMFDVLPDTPAERAGFRPGDFVTHIGGVPVGERGCEPLSDMREAVLVTLVREGERLELPLEAAALVE